MIDWTGPVRQPCPSCSRSDRDKTLGVTINADGSGVARCFRCDYIETLRDEATIARAGSPRPAPVGKLKHERLSDFGRALWDACGPLRGIVLDYLAARCCMVPPADGDLRFHPALTHPPSGTTGQALVALATDAITGVPLSLHRTWITATGKAPLDPSRMLLGGHRKAGGVIRLWPDTDVTMGLAIGEGIETCLSVAHAFTPVWSAIDAGNLAAFPVLGGIESLTICADNDAAGIRAARACATAWARAGREVRIVRAPEAGADINDLARRAA